MRDTDLDTLMRMAAFEHVRNLADIYDHLTATELNPGFVFEGQLLGIDPDYRLHVSDQVLDQDDGPMLEALEQLNGQPLHLLHRAKDRPDRDWLAKRFEQFKAVV